MIQRTGIITKSIFRTSRISAGSVFFCEPVQSADSDWDSLFFSFLGSSGSASRTDSWWLIQGLSVLRPSWDCRFAGFDVILFVHLFGRIEKSQDIHYTSSAACPKTPFYTTVYRSWPTWLGLGLRPPPYSPHYPRLPSSSWSIRAGEFGFCYSCLCLDIGSRIRVQ